MIKPAPSVAEYRKHAQVRVDAINHALAGIPEERVRYHLCWGSWHGPHTHDLALVHLVDIMLKVKARHYLIEAANARHEHEYAVWEKVKLPRDKVLIPGVVTHSTDVVEHPELVSQRIQRFARLVGRERVMAGADCGFGGRSHPQIAWATAPGSPRGRSSAARRGHEPRKRGLRFSLKARTPSLRSSVPTSWL